VPNPEPHSVERLIGQQYTGLVTLFRRKVGNHQLADDMINQAVATALEHVQAGRVAQPAQIAGYIFRVAMNHLRNHRRKADERSGHSGNPGVIENLEGEAGDDEAEARILWHVRRMVEELPTPRDRDVVKRFYLEEQGKDEICGALGLAPLQFDKVIFRARRRMRELLEARGFKKSDFFGFLLCAFA
jgi:RNA polymerase sigma-70 factor (ECF subfamily)